MRYVIRCIKPDMDGEYLLWSNDEGWTEGDNFEVYTAQETTEKFNLPIDGEWVELITS